MLKIYLVSVIIWLIILIATDKFVGGIIKNKKINYKKYTKGKGKANISYMVVSFIPVVRAFVWGVMIYLAGADEKNLDKLFEDKTVEEKRGKI